MAYEVIRVEKKEGGYGIITFDRPEKFNAANAQIFRQSLFINQRGRKQLQGDDLLLN